MQQQIINFDETYVKQLLVNGLFFGFIGETGCGKSITLTWFAYWINRLIKGMDIGLFANYHFKGEYWNYKFLEHPDELLKIEYGFAFTDDMWRWCLDSYESTTKALSKYDDLQATGRKKGISMFASSQRFMRLDRNFRDNIHYIVFPQTFLDSRGIPRKVSVIVVNNQTNIFEHRFAYNPVPVFDMYKTREEIIKFSDMRKIDYHTLAMEFFRGYEEPNKLPSQSRVDLFLNDKGIIYDFTENERKILKQKIWVMLKKRKDRK